MLVTTYITNDDMSITSPKYESSNVEGVVVEIKPNYATFVNAAKMRKALSGSPGDYIEIYDYTPEWEELELDGQELVIDCCRMVITKLGNVYWQGIVKHSNISIHTEEVAFSKLFKKCIEERKNKTITGENNSVPYEELRSIAGFAIDTLDIENLQDLAFTSVLNFFSDCTDEQVEQQKEFYNYED